MSVVRLESGSLSIMEAILTCSQGLDCLKCNYTIRERHECLCHGAAQKSEEDQINEEQVKVQSGRVERAKATRSVQ